MRDHDADGVTVRTAHRMVDEWAARDPNAAAIQAPGRPALSYGALSHQIGSVVQVLNDLGIRRNDRVALVLPDGPELAVALVSVAAGAACAPLNPDYQAPELESCLARLGCRAVVVEGGSTSPAVPLAEALGIRVLELIPEAARGAGLFRLAETGRAVGWNRGNGSRPESTAEFAGLDDIAIILPTSGTSARPKLVPLTHRNIAAAAQGIRESLELVAGDRCLNVMPLFHIHGQSTIYASIGAGASVVCPGRFTVDSFFQSLDSFRPTWYTAAPTIQRAIVHAATGHPDVISRSSLRVIRSASAAMPRPLIQECERVFRVPFVEAYGMTEAGPLIATNRVSDNPRKEGSVGRPVGTSVAVIDQAGNLLLPGHDGEIVVRGPNVTSGYDNDPDANQAAFIHGWLRTGDRGHLDADGHLFITGRFKELVNRGGEKISPREVEQVLSEHPEVAEVVAFPVPHPTLGEDLAVAIVRGGPAEPNESPRLIQELRRLAADRLAAFKIPQQILVVDRIPEGSTGKVRRLELARAFGLDRPAGAVTDPVAPRDPIEDRLATIWMEVLRISRPGVDDNFFQSGGDSLQAVQVAARLCREFPVAVPPQVLFEHPTIAELARLVARELSVGGKSSAVRRTMPRRDPAGPVPVSFAQRRLWLLDQIEPGSPAYNMQTALQLSGHLRQDVLERSLSEIVRRHESLRTTFRLADDQPVQIVGPATPVRLTVVDLTRLAPGVRETEVERLAAADASRPFHLADGPLFRATALRLHPTEHVLLLTAHHIVSDAWSTTILLRELGALYTAFSSGQASPLSELPIQFGDYAVWQRHQSTEEQTAVDVDYWKTALSGAPPLLDLPADRPRPSIPTRRGASHRMFLSRDLTAKLDALSRRENVTPFMTLLAAFQTLLYRYSGQPDIVVGAPVAGRAVAESECAIGFFANTLVIRSDLSGRPSFRELLARVRETARRAYTHQDLPFERVVEELDPDRDQGGNPLFQVMFAFQNVPNDGVVGRWSNLSVERLELARPAAKFDLTLYLSESPKGLSVTLQYSTDLFDQDRIARMAGHLRTLLTGIVADPDCVLSDLPLLTDGERDELIRGWNPTAGPSPNEPCFHQRFEAQARSTPDQPAVVSGDQVLTYAQLNRKANRLARRLTAMGVRSETMVGIFLDRSTDLVVAALAVMKAGGAYVPLDPSYPADHRRFVLADADVVLLITEEKLIPALRSTNGAPPRPVCLVADPSVRDEDQSDQDQGISVAPDQLAYVIYTSGSTGKPKGVMITHRNLSHYVHAMVGALGVGADDGYLHTASFAFSSSVRQFAVPLSCGARVVIASTDTIRDPRALFELIKDQSVSIADIVPSYWRACNRILADLPTDTRTSLLTNQLRLILSASEPLPSDIPNEWSRVTRHGAQLINMFGQTETAGIVAVHRLSPFDREGVMVPIGRPIANTRAYVLDQDRKPVPVGVWGELYIGGAGVGLGYLNDGHLTDEKFVADPFSDVPGARLYRTGDLTRYRSNGDLEFLGRLDHQVKLRGYRIEPSLIEAAVLEHTSWRECAVAVREDGAGQRQLAAYVAPSQSGTDVTRELRDHLKRKLPDYYVPTVVVGLPFLPRTPNGKVDRSALAKLIVDRPNGSQSAASPPTVTVPPPETAAAPPSSIAGLEDALTQLWVQVLGVGQISPEDNFFDLGGNSLLAIEMIGRASRAGIDLTPKELWQHQTIGELARVVARKPALTRKPPEPAPDARPRRASVVAEELPGRVRVTVDSLRAYGREALERAGLDPAGAAIVTEVQLEASLRDQPTHNMVSIPRYARRIVAGTINARPNIRVEHQTDISARIDGDNGPGQWVAVTAMEAAIQIARRKGVGVVGVRKSNHLGAAGHYPWLAAREGLIGICTTNGPVILAPTGGVTPTFGNNPLGVGIPAGDHHPILLDIAMSVAPRGRIGLHLAEGRPLPPGWILDRHGNPSTDPADLVAGLGVPIGGHKGYGLTLIMEVLAGVLTGASFGWDNRREHTPHLTKPADFGHFFMAIDPELFLPRGEFLARVDRMIEETKSGDRAHGVAEILVPGEAELRARERNLRDGVPLRPSTYQALRKYARAAGLDTELAVVRHQDAAMGNTSSAGTA